MPHCGGTLALVGSAFTDGASTPTEAQIREVLGPAGDAWSAFNVCLEQHGVAAEWHFYRDGGWLLKATRSGNTIAWASVERSTLLVTCHFAERHRAELTDCTSLSAELRERVRETPQRGGLVSIQLAVRTPADIPDIDALLACKLAAG